MKTTFKSISKYLLFFILLNITTFPLYAQVVVEDSLRVQLDEIRVEAAHSSITIGEAPLSLSYLVRGNADLAARPAATMDELTFSLPGVFISNRENYALGERMTIRGLGWRSQFGVRGVHVVLDDIPLTVADGQTIMNMIDPATVQRIELLRGPSATFWGNSSGGVLYMSTKPAPDAPMIQYRGYGGSYSTIKQEIRLNSRIGDTRIYGYATYFDTEGFRDHSAARLFRGSIGGERSVSDNGYVTFRATYAGMPKAEHPGSLTGELAKESPSQARDLFVNTATGKQFHQAMLSASYIHDFETGILNVTTHGTYRDLDNPVLFRYVGLERLAGGARSTYEFQNLPFDLNIGGELKYQRDDRFVTDNESGSRGSDIQTDQLETVSNQALFARINVPLNDRFSINTGVRGDRITFKSEDFLETELEGSRNFFSINPSAGFVYKLSSARFFGNFSTSFESPTTTELVNRPEDRSGFNQNLDPEKTVSFETGIRGEAAPIRTNYDIALFVMQVDDIIIPFELDEFPGVSFFRNQGKTIHYGLETSLAFFLNNDLDLRLMLNLLRAEFNGGEYDGNAIPGVAPFRFGGLLTYTPGNHSISVDNEWVGRYQANSENTESNSPYSLVNIRWSVELNGLFDNVSIRPFISVQNLLNTRYNTSLAVNAIGNRFYEPGTDRNFRAGIQINLF